MKQKLILSSLFVLILFTGFKTLKTGLFENNADVGNPKIAGSSSYNAQKKEYTLTGSGYNIWFERDEFQYLFKELKGDFTVKGDFELVGKGADPHRKVGWMVRESLDADASHLSAVIHGDGLTVLQWRIAKGEKMRDPEDEIFSKEKNVRTVQIEKKGTLYTMRVASKGQPLQIVGSRTMPNLPEKVMVGMYICSHNPAVKEEVKVSDVTIVQN